jgi:hypothetical protein
MSVQISSKLIYGIPYAEIPDEFTEKIDQLLYDSELDYTSPFYDSPRSFWIVGVEVQCCGLSTEELILRINSATEYLNEILKLSNTDLEFSLFVDAHVT